MSSIPGYLSITKEEIQHLEDAVKKGSTGITEQTATLAKKLFKAIEGSPDFLPEGVKQEELCKLATKVTVLSLKGLNWSGFRKLGSAIKNLLSGVGGGSSAHLLHEKVKEEGYLKASEQFVKKGKEIKEESTALSGKLDERVLELKKAGKTGKPAEGSESSAKIDKLWQKGEALYLEVLEFIETLNEIVKSDTEKDGPLSQSDINSIIKSIDELNDIMNIAEVEVRASALLVSYLTSPDLYEGIEEIKKQANKNIRISRKKDTKPITKDEVELLQKTVEGDPIGITKQTADLAKKLFVTLEDEDIPFPEGVEKKELEELSGKVKDFALDGLGWSGFRKVISAIRNLLSGGVSSAHSLYKTLSKEAKLAHMEKLHVEAKRLEEEVGKLEKEVADPSDIPIVGEYDLGLTGPFENRASDLLKDKRHLVDRMNAFLSEVGDISSLRTEEDRSVVRSWNKRSSEIDNRLAKINKDLFSIEKKLTARIKFEIEFYRQI